MIESVPTSSQRRNSIVNGEACDVARESDQLRVGVSLSMNRSGVFEAPASTEEDEHERA